MGSLNFDDRDGWIWLDGQFVEWREAKVHILSHALHYGSAVFEGQRAYNGKIFALEAHTERLFCSADILGMIVPYSKAEINQACVALLEKTGLKDAYCRPVFWRGSEKMGISTGSSKAHAAVAIWEWPSYFGAEERLKGLRLDIARWRRPAPDCAPVEAKASGLYMICTLAKHEAEHKGYQDALMCDYRGYVAEATGANIFFVKDGILHTPKADCFLNGITRKTVIKLAQERGIEVRERVIELKELASFEQAFLTGTAAEVTPVSAIGTDKFEVGALVKEIMQAYEHLVKA